MFYLWVEERESREKNKMREKVERDKKIICPRCREDKWTYRSIISRSVVKMCCRYCSKVFTVKKKELGYDPTRILTYGDVPTLEKKWQTPVVLGKSEVVNAEEEVKLSDISAGEFMGRAREAIKLIEDIKGRGKPSSEEKVSSAIPHSPSTISKIEPMTAFRDTLIAAGSMIVSLSLGTPLPLLAMLLIFVGTRHFTALMDNIVDILSGVKQFIGRAGRLRELQDKEREVKELTEKAVVKERDAEEKFKLLDSKIKEFEERIGRAIETINVDEVIRRMNLGQERMDKYQVQLIGWVQKLVGVVEVIAKTPISINGDVNELKECIKEMKEIMQGEVVEISGREVSAVEKPLKVKAVDPEIRPQDIPVREQIHYLMVKERIPYKTITHYTGFTENTIKADVVAYEVKLKQSLEEKQKIEVPAQ